MRFELIRGGSFKARLVPPPALAVDASQTTREGLKDLVGNGWSEFEFDSEARNGLPKPPPAENTTGDEADVVN